MLIDLEPVFNNEGFELSFDYPLDISGVEYNADYPFVKPVRVKGSVANQTGIVKLNAAAHIDMNCRCDRCAGDVGLNIRVPVNRILVRQLNDEANDEFMVVQDIRLNLDPIVTEEIFLTLPSKILCKPDCLGLCPVCGKNRNDGPCGCVKRGDPRLEELKKYFES